MQILTTIIARIDNHILSMLCLLFVSASIFPLIKKSNLPTKHLRATTNTIFSLTIIDAIYIVLETLKLPNLAFATSASYAMSLVLSYVLLYNVTLCFYAFVVREEPSILKKLILAFPIYINIFVIIANFITPIYFQLNANYKIETLPILTLHTILSQCYGVYIIFFIIKHRKKTSIKTKALFILTVALPIIVSLTEMLVKTNSMLYPIISFCICIVYIVLKNAYSTTDPVTQVENYAAMFQRINKIENKNYSLALLDIDNLQTINREFSYTEGDLVLAYVAQKIEKNLPQSANIFFAGQDEFTICFDNMTDDEIQNTLSNLEELFKDPDIEKKRGYTVSYTAVVEKFDQSKYKTVLDVIKYLYYQTYIVKATQKNIDD